MDTSKEYIEMIDNPWIQGDELTYPMLMFGDYFIRRILFEMGKEQGVKNFALEILFDYRSQAVFTCTADTSRNYIRVLRQDQLQNMLYDEDCPTAWHLFIDFDEFLVGYISRELKNYDLSAEQLWLAFVMYKKWEKKWNGEDWV